MVIETIQLFASRGFHETSMSEVAREAKVSKALIFWHFQDQGGSLPGVLNRLLEPYIIDFTQESEILDAREQIKKLIGGYVNFVRENASRSAFSCPLHVRREMPDALTEQIRRLDEFYKALPRDLRELKLRALLW